MPSSSKSSVKSAPSIHQWFIQVLIHSDNAYQLLFYILATVTLGIICYHNMIMWSHYYSLFNGNSLEKMTKYTMLLVAHLGLFTLGEALSVWSYKYLANQLANAYTKSLHNKTLSPRVKILAEDGSKYVQITSRDIQTVMDEYLGTLRAMVFGLVVVIGNITFLIRQRLLGFLVVFSGFHGMISVINNLITNGWGSKNSSLEQAINNLNKTQTQIVAHDYVKRAVSLAEQTQSHSWEAVHASKLEKKRYQQQQQQTTKKSLTDIVTKLYNRLQHPLMMGALLFLKRPTFPLKTTADAVSGVSHIGGIYQSVQAAIQMRIHLGFFYTNSESNAKRNAAFNTIQAIASKLGWRVEDIQPKQKNAINIWVLLLRQLVIASTVLLATEKLLSIIAGYYPSEVWVAATLPAAGLGSLLSSIALGGVVVMGLFYYQTRKPFWHDYNWESVTTLSITCLKLLAMSLLQYSTFTITMAYLFTNIGLLAGVVLVKNKTFGAVKKPEPAKPKPINHKSLTPKVATGPLDIVLDPVRMQDATKQDVWHLADTVKIQPKAGKNTFLIQGANGAGKSLIVQYIQYLIYKESGAANSESDAFHSGSRGWVYYANSIPNHMLPDASQTRIYVLPQPQQTDISGWNIDAKIINDYTLSYSGKEASVVDFKEKVLAKLMAYKFVKNPIQPESLDDYIIRDLLDDESKLLAVTYNLLKVYGLEKYINSQEEVLVASGGTASKIQLAMWAALTAIPDINKGCHIHLVADEPGPGLDNDSTYKVYQAFLAKFTAATKCAFTTVLHQIDKDTENLFQSKLTVTHKSKNSSMSKGPKETIVITSPKTI